MHQTDTPALDGYTIHARVAEGGFGTVFRATQRLAPFSREVAIKVIRQALASSPAFIRRFEVEAETIARLEHPHIVPLYDYWRDAGGAYLVMRWMAGGSLAERLGAGRPPLDMALALAGQIAAALALAHRRGVIHQDLKPANVLLDAEGNAYLADFGIARRLGVAEGEQGAAFTPGYAAPEQIRAGASSPQSDIYSFGVLLYELLSGARAFDAPTPTERIRQQLAGPPPPLAPRFPDLPPAVDALIARATDLTPERRYPAPAELLADLALALGGAASPTGGAAARPGRPGGPAATLVFELDDADTPYKGLRAFHEADATDFFGRADLVRQLLVRLSSAPTTPAPATSTTDPLALTLPAPPSNPAGRFVLLVGPSGSGKSSAVRAGLLPALRRGELPGAQRWFFAELTPGPRPIESLAAALARVSVAPPADLAGLLAADADGLGRAVERVLPADGAVELLLLVDQLEELFTLTGDEATRAHVLESLQRALTAPGSRLRLLATLRADFYDRPLAYPGFAELMRQGSELALPLTPAELERAIVGPAERVGAVVEPALVAAMLADVGAQPGALPLLQYALTELFARRAGRALTLAAYQSSGGVRGALARKAEELYAGLDAAGQAAARQLLLRLVTPGEGAEDTRRRARLAELDAGDATRAVLDGFGAARLLTFDRDGQTRAPTVELAHEALLRAWARLQGWVGAAREDLLAHRRLGAAAAEWEASGREPSFLAQGARLAQFAGLAEGGALALNVGERAFLAASREAAEGRARRDRARALWLALAGLVALAALVAAGFFTLDARRSGQAAVEQQATAAVAIARSTALAAQDPAAELALQAHAQRLAFSASDVAETQPAAALLLAIEAALLERSPVTTQGLQRLLTSEREPMRGISDAMGLHEQAFTFNPFGGTQGLNTTPTGAALLDDERILVTMEDGTTFIWRAGSKPLEFVRLEGHTFHVSRVMTSADGAIILTGSNDGTTRLWDSDGNSLAAVEHSAKMNISTLSPAGDRFLTAEADGSARLWDAGGNVLATLKGDADWVATLVFSPDGSTILVGYDDGSARLWSADGRPGAILRGTDSSGPRAAISTAFFSPDGSRMVTAANDGTTRLWTSAGELLAELGDHADPLIDGAFSPDSSRVVIVERGNAGSLWDQDGGLLSQFAGDGEFTQVVFSPDGQHFVTGLRDRGIQLWDGENGQLLATLESITTRLQAMGDMRFTADGSRLLTVSIWGATSVFLVRFEDLLAAAACTATRPLSAEEIATFEVPTPLQFDFAGRVCPPRYSWEQGSQARPGAGQ